MHPSNFDKLYKTIMENIAPSANITGAVLGGNQMSQFSGDNYAPGDTRIPKILGMKKKKKKPFQIIRRNFPKGL